MVCDVVRIYVHFAYMTLVVRSAVGRVCRWRASYGLCGALNMSQEEREMEDRYMLSIVRISIELRLS